MSPYGADIRMSTAVAEALDASTAHQVRSTALAGGRCDRCRLDLPDAGPVNVVVTYDSSTARIVFVHLACGESRLQRVPDGEVITAGPAVPQMRVRSQVLAVEGQPVAALTAELLMQAIVRHPGTQEGTDPVLALLLEHGMHLATDLRQAPAGVRGWSVALGTGRGGTSTVQITAAGRLFFAGPVVLPPGWRATTSRRGGCLLYCGTGLADATGQVSRQSLALAASAGRLVAATLPLS